MTSIKGKIYTALMRNHHILEGKLRKERFTMETSIQGFRDKCEKGASRYARIPENLKVESDNLAGIRAEWITPEDAPEGKLIFYVHGGGYVSGSCNDHRAFVAKLADNSGITTLQFEYRLAPENPFPAALDDTIDVYRAVLERGFKPGNILFAGESAGGGLLIATLLALKEKKMPLPGAAVAISPWTDLTCSGESYSTKNRVSVAPENSWTVFSSYYVGTNNPRNPFISPLFGDPAGLPPMFINSGADDELFDDGRRFSEKARIAGVDVTFRTGENMVHCYPLLSPLFREAREAMDEILEYISKMMMEGTTRPIKA